MGRAAEITDISVDFPDGTEGADLSTEQLASMVLDLKKEILQMKEKE